MTTATQQTSTAPNGKRTAIRAIVPTLVRDVGVPTLAYYLLHWNGASDWQALGAGALVSLALLVREAIKDRKLDVFAVVMVCVFAFGLVTSLISGDARLLIVKESFGTGLVGLAFLVSSLTRKPLIYFAASRAVPDPAGFDATYQASPRMQTRMRRMSAVWGMGFLIEAAVRVLLAYQLPVSTMVWLSNVLLFGTIGLLVAGTVLTGEKRGSIKH